MQDEDFLESEFLKAEFGKKMRVLRQQCNITQEHLAELIGISDIYLRKIESGECAASWVIWLTLCTVLNIDIKTFQRKYLVPLIKEHAKNHGKAYFFTSNN